MCFYYLWFAKGFVLNVDTILTQIRKKKERRKKQVKRTSWNGWQADSTSLYVQQWVQKQVQ